MLDCLYHSGVFHCSSNWAFYCEIRHGSIIISTMVMVLGRRCWHWRWRSVQQWFSSNQLMRMCGRGLTTALSPSPLKWWIYHLPYMSSSTPIFCKWIFVPLWQLSTWCMYSRVIYTYPLLKRERMNGERRRAVGEDEKFWHGPSMRSFSNLHQRNIEHYPHSPSSIIYS